MKKIAIIFYLCLSAWQAQAETLPLLQGINTPVLAQSNIINKDFALYLEKEGDYQNAILEWRRLVYQSSEASLQSLGLFTIAELYRKNDQPHKSIQAYQKLLTVFPQTKRQIQALYQISRLADITGDTLSGDSARSRLLRLQKKSVLATEAELHHLWAQGLRYNDNFISPQTIKGQKLKAKLVAQPVQESSLIETATLLALIPGVGYLYLGYFSGGLLMMMLSSTFFYAVITSMKAKHWGYGFVFGSFATFIYVMAMFHTSTLAMSQAYETRIAAMKTWHKLQPKDIYDFNKKEMVITPSLVEVIYSFQAPHNKKVQ